MAQIQNKKLILFLILGILVILGTLLIYNYYLKPKEKLENKIETKETEKTVSLPPPPKVEVTQPGINKILEVFPKDIIQEKDAQIINSYEANIEGGTKQYIIRYLSKKSSREIFEIYSNYFKKNNWAILSGGKIQDSLMSVSWSKKLDNVLDTINITTTQNSNTKENIVEIMLLRRNIINQ